MRRTRLEASERALAFVQNLPAVRGQLGQLFGVELEGSA